MASSLWERHQSNPGVGSMQPGRVVSYQSRGNRGGMTSDGMFSLLAGRGGGGTTRQQPEVSDVISDMRRSQQEANKANEQRYEQLLSSLQGAREQLFGDGGLYGQAQQKLEGQGAADRHRIEQNQQQQSAQVRQQMISRGLGNTTVLPSMQRGVAADAEQAQQAVSERVSGQQAGLLTQQAGAQQSFAGLYGDAILSRQDQPISPNLYLQLIQQLGAQGV